jgi:hypothetical protein
MGAWTVFFDFVVAIAAVAVVVAAGSVFAAVGFICWMEEVIALPPFKTPSVPISAIPRMTLVLASSVPGVFLIPDCFEGP